MTTTPEARTFTATRLRAVILPGVAIFVFLPAAIVFIGRGWTATPLLLIVFGTLFVVGRWMPGDIEVDGDGIGIRSPFYSRRWRWIEIESVQATGKPSRYVLTSRHRTWRVSPKDYRLGDELAATLEEKRTRVSLPLTIDNEVESRPLIAVLAVLGVGGLVMPVLYCFWPPTLSPDANVQMQFVAGGFGLFVLALIPSQLFQTTIDPQRVTRTYRFGGARTIELHSATARIWRATKEDGVWEVLTLSQPGRRSISMHSKVLGYADIRGLILGQIRQADRT